MDSRFKNALNSNNILVIVGTGYTAFSSGGHSHATWRGLISEGIATLKTLGRPEQWIDIQRKQLDYGFRQGDMNSILASASAVSSALNETGDFAFTKWLSETVGRLRVTDSSWTDAILKLPYPIFTTNYDTLLATNSRQAVDWLDHSAVNDILSGVTSNIGHIHGRWNNPSSIIFSDQQYQGLLNSETAQSLQRGASTTKSIVYLGFGSGLTDPNFSRMIRWHRDHLGTSGARHFRLCRRSEMDQLSAEHANDHIIPIEYGSNYEDLPDFLQSLAAQRPNSLTNAGITRDVISEVQAEFDEDLKTESILADTISDLSERELSDVILPPPLLPVPHAEYLRSSPHTKLERLDPIDEINYGGVMILAAEENAGLTTAIKWLASEAAKYISGAAPIYISFKSCGKRARTLSEQLAKQARARHLVDKVSDSLPPHVLCLDDFSPSVKGISEYVLQGICDSDSLFTIVGCTQGQEQEIVQRFEKLGVKARVRYLGKLNASDIRKYACVLSPSEPALLANKVIATLGTENLDRTPTTVSLLLSIFHQGGSIGPNASRASILDQYIGQLFVMQNPHEGATSGLDEESREEVLSELAEMFVEEETSALSEASVIASFTATFDKLSWNESAADALSVLLDLHILKRRDKNIEFARSSFLHLYAAKRALANQRFRTKLFARPLHYSSAITDYAALSRRDEALLSNMRDLLNDLHLHGSSLTYYTPLALQMPGEISPVDAEEPISTEPLELQDGTPRKQSRDTGIEQIEDSIFDFSDDLNRPPFPTSNEDTAPLEVRAFRTLDLASVVLRDSYNVDNKPLRRELLSLILSKWNQTMHVVHQNQIFGPMIDNLAQELNLISGDPEKDGYLSEELGKALPAAFVMAAIGNTLASRKLTLLLQDITNTDEDDATGEIYVMAAFFLFALGEPGWPDRISDLRVHRENIWIVRHFLLALFEHSYIERSVSESDEDDLLRLCVNISQRGTKYKGQLESEKHGRALTAALKKSRVKRRFQKTFTAEDTSSVISEK